MPDPLMGERVCAYIQPKAEVRMTFEQALAFLMGQKASVLQLPERIEFIEAVPYTGFQKLDEGRFERTSSKNCRRPGRP